MTIEMKVDSVPSTPTVKVFWKDTTQEITPKSAPDSSAIKANQNFTVQVRWGDICSKAGLNDDCTYTDSLGADSSKGLAESLLVGVTDGGTSFQTGSYQKFTVRLTYAKPDDAGSLVAAPVQPSASSDPFTDFMVLPGDSKVYVADVYRGSTGLSESGIKWSALRVYYQNFTEPTPPSLPSPDFCEIDYAGGNFVDLLVQDKSNVETTLSDNKVSGLENEDLYMFNIATVDEASVVSGFISPTTLSALSDIEKQRYYSQPGEVVGLLGDKKCFIATAAFGSPLQPKVQLLRQFRDQFLVNNEWGRSFVKAYYRYSPPVAQTIEKSEFLKSVVRGLLWPLVLFADLALQFGAATALVFFALALVAFAVLARQYRSQS